MEGGGYKQEEGMGGQEGELNTKNMRDRVEDLRAGNSQDSKSRQAKSSASAPSLGSSGNYNLEEVGRIWMYGSG